MPEVPEVQEDVLFVVHQQPHRTVHEILGKTPTDGATLRHAQMFLDVLLHDASLPVRKAVLKAVLSWPREMTATLTEAQITKMAKDLVDALSIKASLIKELDLEARMAAMGVEKKDRRAPVALLGAFYDVKLDELARACEQASEKRRAQQARFGDRASPGAACGSPTTRSP
jgi:hypothetical protein